MLRLHGRCPVCSYVEPLRPDGTLEGHYALVAEARVLCRGAGTQPVAGSVEAWLATQELSAARTRDVAETHLRAATTRHAEVSAWITKQRARLAKGRE